MNKTYEITEDDKLDAIASIEETSKALTNIIANPNGGNFRFVNPIESACRHLTTILNRTRSDNPPVLTSAECEFSICLHTFLRKCCDDDLSNLLYASIADDISPFVWGLFIKACYKRTNEKLTALLMQKIKNDFVAGSDAMQNKTLNDKMMIFLIQSWFENGLKEALEEISTWG